MFKTLRSKLLFGTIISVVVINIIFTIFIALFLENTLRTDIIKEITNIKSFSINTINQNELIGESKWKSLNSIKGLTNSYVSMINDKGEEVACREMRKRFCAYSKGIHGGAELRRLLVSASTKKDYECIFKEASKANYVQFSRKFIKTVCCSLILQKQYDFYMYIQNL